MVTIFDTAKYILEKLGKTSSMKLQKLCYYAQAWSLVWDDKPLFDEDFVAWASGPVCLDLFAFSDGQFSISPEEMKGDSSNLAPNQKETVDKILDCYGDKSAQWLSQLTKMEAPWRNARFASLQKKEPVSISTDSMARYYSGKY